MKSMKRIGQGKKKNSRQKLLIKTMKLKNTFCPAWLVTADLSRWFAIPGGDLEPRI